MVFHARLDGWLAWSVDHSWLEQNVEWKEFPGGTRLGKIQREGDTGLVLYHVPADAGADAFRPHMHTGGEMYLVLEGEVSDDAGTYPAGSLVWMAPDSRHKPMTNGDTLILVLWPAGVKNG